MVPRLHFHYLLWSYLPGFPVALSIFLILNRLNISTNLIGNSGSILSTLYFVLAPLVCGLFLDGFRHIIPDISGNVCFAWLPSWKDVPKSKLRTPADGGTCAYPKECIEVILSTSSLTYCMYEFFGNFVIAILFSSITCYWFFIDSLPINGLQLILISSLLILLSLFCMKAFSRMQNEHINSWFDA